jgi:Arc/MetJ family transcription regulator
MCKFDMEGTNMATNLAINDDLLTSAYNISGLKTKKETVNLALEEFIQRRRRKEAMEMFGKIDFNNDWNPRKARGKI